MYVVVNVDDFGLHRAVNRAVKRLGELGIVTSSTILANGPFAFEFRNLDNIGFGIHLNLLRGKPITNPVKIDSLLNEKGNLLGDYKKLFLKYLRKKLDLNQVKLEWENQIVSLLDQGLKPTHLDSEKHIHTWPKLMAIVLQLAEKYNISWVRRPVESIANHTPSAGLFRIIILKAFSAFHIVNKDVYWPELVWGIADQGINLNPLNFEKYIQNRKSLNLIELVVHPGLPEESDHKIDESFGKLRVTNQWAIEYAALSDPRWMDIFEKYNIKLANYGELDPSIIY